MAESYFMISTRRILSFWKFLMMYPNIKFNKREHKFLFRNDIIRPVFSFIVFMLKIIHIMYSFIYKQRGMDTALTKLGDFLLIFKVYFTIFFQYKKLPIIQETLNKLQAFVKKYENDDIDMDFKRCWFIVVFYRSLEVAILIILIFIVLVLQKLPSEYTIFSLTDMVYILPCDLIDMQFKIFITFLRSSMSHLFRCERNKIEHEGNMKSLEIFDKYHYQLKTLSMEFLETFGVVLFLRFLQDFYSFMYNAYVFSGTFEMETSIIIFIFMEQFFLFLWRTVIVYNVLIEEVSMKKSVSFYTTHPQLS